MVDYLGVSSLQSIVIDPCVISTDAHGFNLVPLLVQVHPLSITAPGTKVFILPGIEPKATIIGVYSPGIDQEFYGHIILWPTTINLGLVLTAKYYDLSLWNLTGYSQTLLDWVVNGLDGAVVTNVDGSPVEFGPLTYREYLLTVSAQGSSNLVGNVTFNFASLDPLVCTITGTRTVVFSFNPNWRDPAIEKLEWFTDVITNYDRTEQRLALRQLPRRSLEHLFTFETANKMSMFEAQMFGWMSKVFVVPVWQDWQLLGATVAAGSTTAPVYTPLRDFVAGGLLIIWHDYKTWEVIEVETFTTTLITFAKPTTMSWVSSDYVIPVKLARLSNLINLAKHNPASKETKLEFFFETALSASPNRIGVSTWPQYLGLDVLITPPCINDNDDETIYCETSTVDAAKGTWWTDGNTDIGTTHTRTYKWVLKTRQEIANFLAFLEARKGRQVPFWMPSWSNDFQTLQTVSSVDTSLLVNGIGYTQMVQNHANRSDIVFFFVDNSTPLYRHITGSADPADGTETISISAALGKNVPIEGFKAIAFLNYVRLASDTITIERHTDSIATVSIDICEVPK